MNAFRWHTTGLILLSLATFACGDDDGDVSDGSTGAPSTGTGSTGTSTASSTSSATTGASSTGTETTTTTDGDDDTSGSSSGTSAQGDDSTESSSGSDSGSESSTGGGAQASIRVMHLGVNAPAVDVFANEAGPVFENLSFRESTSYAVVPADAYTFQVSVSGSPADEAVLSPELTLDPDTRVTAVALGDLESGETETGLQALALIDDAADLSEDDVRITVVHAAPAVGQVDLWEISDLENPILLLEDVDFAAYATLLDVPAGALVLALDVDDDAAPDVVFDVDASELGGATVNAFANNDADGNVSLVLQLDDDAVAVVDPS